MKFLLASLLAFFALVAQAQTKPGTETVKFKTSAVCDMCKTRIEKSMAYAKGVQSATLDVASQMLTVNYRPDKTSVADLRTVVQKTGYDADEATADAKAYDRLPECCKKTNKVH